MLGKTGLGPCCSKVGRRLLSTEVVRQKPLEAKEGELANPPAFDISGLRPRHRIIANGGVPPVQFEWERTKVEQAKRFGHYGLKSGVDLGSLYPTLEEIEEEKAIGLYREYKSAVAEMKSIQEKKKAKDDARIAQLEKNLAKYPSLLSKYEASQVKAEKERDEKELVLERRIREIQEYFGYWMDPKDPRFEVMLQQKEQEEKKAEKMAKRAEHLKKKIAEL